MTIDTPIAPAAIRGRPRLALGSSLALALAGPVVLVVAVWLTSSPSEPFFNNDETRHLMTGVFFRDAIADDAWRAPYEYVVRYYLQYPALGLLVWPPLFYALEGIAMLAFGPSLLVSKMMVLAFGCVATWYVFWLGRPIVGAPFAALATCIFSLSPLVLPYARQAMLEIPTLAVVLAALYHTAAYLDDDRGVGQAAGGRPSLRPSAPSGLRRGKPSRQPPAPSPQPKERPTHLWLGAAAAAAAVLTRFDGAVIVPTLLIVIALRGAWRRLLAPRVLLAGLTALLLVAPVAWLTASRFGGVHASTMVTQTADGTSLLPTAAMLMFYPMDLPNQVGWFALVLALAGLVTALSSRDLRARCAPALALVAATYVTFSPIASQEPRHAIYWVPGVAILAAAGVRQAATLLGDLSTGGGGLGAGGLNALAWGRFIRRPGTQDLQPLLAIALLASTAFGSLRAPAPYIRGYAEAAAYVVSNTSASRFCLFDGLLDGNFTYQVRVHDESRRLWMLRGDKLFYSTLINADTGYTEYTHSDEDIWDVLHTYDPEFVVVESPQVSIVIPMAEKLRAYLASRPDRFALERRFPLESNMPGWQRVSLLVYRKLDRNPSPRTTVDYQMQTLGGERLTGETANDGR